MRIPDQLLDHLGDIYQKYPFKMTFAQFVESVMARIERQRSIRNRANSKNDHGARADKGMSPYDPMRKKVRS